MDTSDKDKVALMARLAIGICATALLVTAAAIVATAATNSGAMSSALAPGGPFWQLLGPLLFFLVIGLLIALTVLLGLPAEIRSLRVLAAMVPAFKVFATFFILTTWGYCFFGLFAFTQNSPNVPAALVSGTAGLIGATGEAAWMVWIAATVRQRPMKRCSLVAAGDQTAGTPHEPPLRQYNDAQNPRFVHPRLAIPRGVSTALPDMSQAWNRLRPLLRQDEKLRWVGQPDPRVNFSGVELFLMPFSLYWGVGMVFWETVVIVNGAPLSFVLYGIPFVVVGLYLSVGRFIYKKHRKLKTFYGLTDSRAIVSSSENSFDDTPVKGAPMRITRSRNGQHVSVIFDGKRQGLYQNTGLDFLNLGQPQNVAFFDVADPDALIRALDQMR